MPGVPDSVAPIQALGREPDAPSECACTQEAVVELGFGSGPGRADSVGGLGKPENFKLQKAPLNEIPSCS